MTSIASGFGPRTNVWSLGLAGLAALVIVAMISPELHRSRTTPVTTQLQQARQSELAPAAYVAKSGSRTVAEGLLGGAAPASSDAVFDRKMVRTSSFDLVVAKPAEEADKIRALAEAMGGYLVSSETSGSDNAASATLTVRVPAARFDEARAQIRQLGLRVESEKVEAQDVTRQYVDQDAGLRNLRSEEAQYLAILKQARTVKDTLEVSEKLGEVRGQIDAQQAEFDALSKQIETVAITVSLRAESEAQVWGLHWRPLYQMKLALRDGLEALAGYGAAMLAILFYLPAVILWAATVCFGWKAAGEKA